MNWRKTRTVIPSLSKTLMPKFWFPDRQEIAAIHMLINEDVWFQRYQDLLLGMANTRVGRDLLYIPQEYPVIVKFHKNCVHFFDGYDAQGNGVFGADFRIGAKWANVIRYRWTAFNSLARYFLANKDLTVPVSPLVLSARAVHALTLTAYPNPNTETTSVDGVVTYTYTSTNWATSHDALSGTSASDTNATLFLQLYRNGGGLYYLERAFTLFDTSSLTSGATISAATYSISENNGGAADADSLSVGIVQTSPASNTAIVSADYDQCGAVTAPTEGATRKTLASLSTFAYNDFALNATGISWISKTDITKLGFRLSRDMDNTAPSGANGDTFDSADASGTTADPKLVVTYTLTAALTETMLNRKTMRGASRGIMRP